MAQLEVSVGRRRQVCQLWRPISVNPVRIEVHKNHSVDVPLSGHLIDHPEKARVQFQLAGTGAAELPAATVGIGELATIKLGDSTENDIELQLRIVPGETRSTLEIKLFGSPPVMEKDGTIRATRREISPSIIQNLAKSGRVRDVKRREAEIVKLKASQGSLQKQITQKEAAMKIANLAVQSRADAEVDSLNQQIAQIETRIEKLEAEMTGVQGFVDKSITWCDSVEKVLRNLDVQAQLRYAVYMPDEPKVMVIETTGFEWDQRHF